MKSYRIKIMPSARVGLLEIGQYVKSRNDPFPSFNFMSHVKGLFMKGDSQVIVAILMFIVGAFFGALIEGELIVSLFEYLPALVTLFAACLGVHYAFTLQSKKEKQDIRNKQIEAVQLELFNFIQMRNSLLNFKRQVIDPVDNKETAFINMKPMLHTLEINSRLAIENLSFLLKSDNPDLLLTLYTERQYVQNILDAINGRSKFYLEVVQPKWQDKKLDIAGEFDPFEAESVFVEALGSMMYERMRETTTQVIEGVESSLIHLEETEKELRETLNKIFPEDGKGDDPRFLKAE